MDIPRSVFLDRYCPLFYQLMIPFPLLLFFHSFFFSSNTSLDMRFCSGEERFVPFTGKHDACMGERQQQSLYI